MTSIRNHIRQSPHRNRLERLLRRTLPRLRGAVLEIGSKNRRYDHWYHSIPTAIDMVENTAMNVGFGDATDLPFRTSTFDGVVCLEVLEYVRDPKRALTEMHRVLAQNGTLVLSVPFLTKEHGDVVRYTSAYVRELLSNFEIVQFTAVGGSWTMVCTILWNKCNSISFVPLRYALLGLCLPLRLVQRRRYSSSPYATGYFVVAKKRL